MYRLKPKKLLKLLSKAREKELEETVWEYWLTLDTEAQKKQPFNVYLRELKKAASDPKTSVGLTEEEILQDAENILKSMGRT
ncbi:hypothetical protein MEZE111188_05580 [Mesobacillus zeae]